MKVTKSKKESGKHMRTSGKPGLRIAFFNSTDPEALVWHLLPGEAFPSFC